MDIYADRDTMNNDNTIRMNDGVDLENNTKKNDVNTDSNKGLKQKDINIYQNSFGFKSKRFVSEASASAKENCIIDNKNKEVMEGSEKGRRGSGSKQAEEASQSGARTAREPSAGRRVLTPGRGNSVIAKKALSDALKPQRQARPGRQEDGKEKETAVTKVRVDRSPVKEAYRSSSAKRTGQASMSVARQPLTARTAHVSNAKSDPALNGDAPDTSQSRAEGKLKITSSDVAQSGMASPRRAVSGMSTPRAVASRVNGSKGASGTTTPRFAHAKSPVRSDVGSQGSLGSSGGKTPTNGSVTPGRKGPYKGRLNSSTHSSGDEEAQRMNPNRRIRLSLQSADSDRDPAAASPTTITLSRVTSSRARGKGQELGQVEKGLERNGITTRYEVCRENGELGEGTTSVSDHVTAAGMSAESQKKEYVVLERETYDELLKELQFYKTSLVYLQDLLNDKGGKAEGGEAISGGGESVNRTNPLERSISAFNQQAPEKDMLIKSKNALRIKQILKYANKLTLDCNPTRESCCFSADAVTNCFTNSHQSASDSTENDDNSFGLNAELQEQNMSSKNSSDVSINSNAVSLNSNINSSPRRNSKSLLQNQNSIEHKTTHQPLKKQVSRRRLSTTDSFDSSYDIVAGSVFDYDDDIDSTFDGVIDSLSNSIVMGDGTVCDPSVNCIKKITGNETPKSQARSEINKNSGYDLDSIGSELNEVNDSLVGMQAESGVVCDSEDDGESLKLGAVDHDMKYSLVNTREILDNFPVNHTEALSQRDVQEYSIDSNNGISNGFENKADDRFSDMNMAADFSSLEHHNNNKPSRLHRLHSDSLRNGMGNDIVEENMNNVGPGSPDEMSKREFNYSEATNDDNANTKVENLTSNLDNGTYSSTDSNNKTNGAGYSFSTHAGVTKPPLSLVSNAGHNPSQSNVQRSRLPPPRCSRVLGLKPGAGQYGSNNDLVIAVTCAAAGMTRVSSMDSLPNSSRPGYLRDQLRGPCVDRPQAESRDGRAGRGYGSYRMTRYNQPAAVRHEALKRSATVQLASLPEQNVGGANAGYRHAVPPHVRQLQAHIGQYTAVPQRIEYRRESHPQLLQQQYQQHQQRQQLQQHQQLHQQQQQFQQLHQQQQLPQHQQLRYQLPQQQQQQPPSLLNQPVRSAFDKNNDLSRLSNFGFVRYQNLPRNFVSPTAKRVNQGY